MRTHFSPRDRGKEYGRRAVLVLGGQAALLSVLGLRFFQLQVLESEHYKLLADENRLNLQMLAPRRGLILDHTGRPLAQNEPRYTLEVTTETLSQFEQSLGQLSALEVFTPAEMTAIRQKREHFRPNLPVLLKNDLNWRQVSKIEYDADHLLGVAITQTYRRSYPEAETMAHMVGYTGPPDESHIRQNRYFLHPLFEVGKIGVERSADRFLRGTFGSSEVEVNARGRIIRHLSTRAAKPGQNLWLPVDSGLQRFVYQRLREFRRGAVIVADARNSAIRAMVSYPSYNPNLFRGGIDNADWQALLNNPGFPLENRAIRGRYPPGSTFKLCVALAALRNGFPPGQRYPCLGAVDFADRTYHCWKRGGHGKLDLAGAIRESCDVYFYELSRVIGIEKIAAEAKRLGLAADSFPDLREALSGIIPSKEWKQRNFSRPWLIGETMITAIGQGYCLTTPLELLAMMLRMLAVGGNTRPPWLWHAPEVLGDQFDAGKPQANAQIADAEVHDNWRKILRKSMQQVVNHPRGTAYPARLEPEALAGKTGTSQVRSISKREREENIDVSGPFHLRDHGLFVGYAPLHKPRFVISVILEHIGSGVVAAVVARDILRWATANVSSDV